MKKPVGASHQSSKRHRSDRHLFFPERTWFGRHPEFFCEGAAMPTPPLLTILLDRLAGFLQSDERK